MQPTTGMFPPYHEASGLQTFRFLFSASMSNMAKIEEMECLLREAQAEKQRLLEHRVRSCPVLKRLLTTDGT